MAYTGLFGDVDETQLTRFSQQVLEQAIARFPAGRGREEQLAVAIEPRALHQIDVQVTVVIVIEQCHAGAHDLGHVVTAGRAVEVMKVETSLSGDVTENRSLICGSRRQGNATCSKRSE